MLSTALMRAKQTERQLEDKYRKITQKEEILSEDGQKIIPRYFGLKSKHNTNYLRYINEDDDRVGGFLHFSGQRMISPYTKFEVEHSNLGKGYVHVRCCFNNKYWVRESSKSNYIVAAANEAHDDLSKWSCTLLEPIYDDHQKAYRFRHVQLDAIVYLSHSNDQYNDCLVAKAKRNVSVIPIIVNVQAKADDDIYALSTIVDWDSIFILPKHVAFKGDNGQYLSFSSPYLKFSSSSITDSSVVQEIFPTKDGNIRIKNDESGRFWYRDPNWIWATSTNGKSNNPNNLFWPAKIDDETLALRNLGNNHFCVRLSVEGKTDCLNSAGVRITDEALLKAAEAVISKTIDNVEYRLNDARIYGQKVVSMAKGDAVNKTKETDTVTFKFTYEEKKKKNWSSSVSSKIGVSVSSKFQVGIPHVGEGKIEVLAEMGAEYEWGVTHKDKNVREFTYPVTVPPMSRVKINAVIKQGICQVPFSYRRTDVLRTGRQVVHHLNDGLFTGVNSYDFEFKSETAAIAS
ncbi:uncharacterized protein LOC111024282 [Momordica charantia]|uniref:Uncharacterized protein LOC111024282 n=1 Tax=Momordica charantia TaxID=3673 RepID=A0A6J1DUY9_MOMCH|nr:uncharacterized protein LOC111024282 [Momordica charantia]